MICLGPVIRAGCDAQCPTVGQYCIGCRGLVPDAGIGAMEEILVQHGLSMDDARRKLQLFNANQLEGVS